MSAGKSGLKRVLSLKHLVAFGFAYLAPTVVFNYYGVATSLTGGMMALAYLITMGVMFFTAYAYAQMVRAFPVSGSAYSYVRRAVNPWIGFGTGWVLLLDYLLLPMICFLLFGIYMNEYVPAVPTVIWVVLAAAFGVTINILGARISGRINIVLVSLQAVFCIVLIGLIVGFVASGGGSTSLIVPEAIVDVVRLDGGSLLWASSILAVSFLGFDAVTTLAEETEEPAKTVPRAIMIVCFGAGIAFAIIAYFLQIAWPTAYRDLADPDTGIFELLPMIGGESLSLTFFVTDQLASILAGTAAIAAVSRVLYSMGRDAILPQRFFGQVSQRFGTPVNNILLTGALSLTAVFYADNLLGAASLTSFGAITGFILVNYAVISHYVIREGRRSRADLCKFLVLPAIGILVNLVLWWNIDLQAKVLGGIWLFVGVIYLGVISRGFRTLPGEMRFDDGDTEAPANAAAARVSEHSA
ncbi:MULTISPECIES: APC family permease [unclassified Leucobacter]|uniref:APC family permease n=1 Tax=unclassified Leucobacter TaxID=2621730 RepID=UPI00165DD451|nr:MULTISPECIES: APC family permease [unclassified Leucobacter]MBC9935703.1 APC family permease [Leucobacter sp. cx-87]